MKLYFDKRLKDPTYYVQHGFRNGSKVTTKNIKNFGKHSELLKITDDPEAYVRAEIKKMNDDLRSGKATYTITADYNEKVPYTDSEFSASTWKNIGYFFLQYIIKDLRLKDFFQQKTNDRKLTFDCYTISRFLTYARILDPSSKHTTWNNLHNYYEQPDFDYQHILRFMDMLELNYDDYLAWLYKNSNSVVKRDTSILYYDCTNFYFECEQPDEDIIDEVTGETIRGLRKYGVSKERRPNPIIEMGLFMDRRGIPISMCLHPGNTSEQITAIPLEKEILKMTDGSKFVYCADAGLGSYNIRKFNSMGGRGFIVTQSIRKLSEILQNAVFNDFDYRLLSDDSPVSISDLKEFDKHNKENSNLYNDFAYKIIIADKALDLGLYEEKPLKNGGTRRVKSTGQLKQRVIITFSRKMMEYQRTVRNRQLERAKKLLNMNDPEEIKKGPNDVKRFMKRITQTKSGEKATVKYILDEEKITAEEKYDVFYAVATNLNDSAKEILAISRKRYQIEDCFRIMKTNFSGRPVNHRLPNRIKAHFLTCYTALLVYRLLEAMLDDQDTHLTPDNLINTLKNMNVANVHDMEYMALYNGSNALDALSVLTSLDLDRKHYRPKDLNKKIKKIL
ncbi:IS1634 family transposase [Lachnospiraceae bacterium OttesenSCG-928-J05]|nr:IS1634 family transposase [Lachnospiraceae bacterium OttesenSCG-928-J05]